MKFVFLVLLSFFAAAVNADVPKQAMGWETGNAGDTYAAEFRLTAKDVVQRLDILFEKNQHVFDTSALKAAVGPSTNVVSEDHVYLNGEEVDAANYPAQHLIKVNRSRWSELRRSTETTARLRVCLHEFLFISGVNDTGFVISDHLIGLLNVGNYSPDIWWNPVNPVNYVMATLSYGPQDCTIGSSSMSLLSSDEVIVLSASHQCSNSVFRKAVIEKAAGVIPASYRLRGLFDTYTITVFDYQDKKLGEMQFEPAWGQCLLPDNGSCQVSGKMTIAGVELVFWFLRD